MTDATATPTHIDKYVITALVCNATVIVLMFLVVGAEFITVLIAGWVSLSFIGAVALSALQPIVGANLLIVGSIPVVPLGMLGILAGLRIRGEVNKRPVPATAGPVRDRFHAVSGPRQLLIGVIILAVGFVVGGVIFAAGLAAFILSFLQKDEVVVTLYDGYMEIRKSPVSGKIHGFSLDEISHTGLFRKGKELAIRYETADGKTDTAKLYAGWIGEENLNKLASLVSNQTEPVARSGASA